MHFDNKSAYAVQTLIAVAVYYYFTNGLRNLRQAYPNSQWIMFLYYFVSFKFRELMTGSTSEALDKVEAECRELEETPNAKQNEPAQD